MNFYNEIDPYAADWLKSLIQSQLIPPGHVDERPIQDVPPKDLAPYVQCHFFAGLGGWPRALHLAGIPPDRPLWTGSCPCQSFSQAGASRGFADERHLWPFWFHLIEQSRPYLVFGEQVASKLALSWFDLVYADLESAGYAVGSADLCAASVGAPHIRQRLWFVGHADGRHAGQHSLLRAESKNSIEAGGSRPTSELAHPNGGHASTEGLQRSGQHGLVAQDSQSVLMGNALGSGLQERERDGRFQRETLEPSERQAAERGSDAGGMVNAASEQVGISGRARQSRGAVGELADAGHQSARRAARPGETESGRPLGDVAGRGFWSDCDWLPCTDGKARPVEPGTFPLVDRAAFKLGSGGPFAGKSRTQMLRCYGNAIVPAVAAAFIKAAIVTP